MLKQTITILESSRVFSLPMTILSWLIIFTYSVIDSGNILYGILALIGLCFAHLGTNVVDDYFDYKSLIKRVDFDKDEYLKNSQKTKCRYLISGKLQEKDLLYIFLAYFGIALLIGLFLFIKCGIGVLYFALIGGVIAILYPFISRICMSELAVAIAYGPALFGGIYYVMTGTYSTEVMFLSIPSMFMAIILLYIHTVMDFEYDLNEGHKTIANRFNSQLDSLIVLKILLICSYISILLLMIVDLLDWQAFLVYLTIPMAIDLYKSLMAYSCDSEDIPEHKWYHFPMENMKFFEKRGEAPFMIRMLQSRNLTIYFSILLTIGIILALAV